MLQTLLIIFLAPGRWWESLCEAEVERKTRLTAAKLCHFCEENPANDAYCEECAPYQE